MRGCPFRHKELAIINFSKTEISGLAHNELVGGRGVVVDQCHPCKEALAKYPYLKAGHRNQHAHRTAFRNRLLLFEQVIINLLICNK